MYVPSLTLRSDDQTVTLYQRWGVHFSLRLVKLGAGQGLYQAAQQHIDRCLGFSHLDDFDKVPTTG